MNRRLTEALAVVATGVLHFVFEEVLHQKALYIGLAVAGWGGYLLWRTRGDRGVLRGWGFRRDNLRAAFVAPTVFAAIAAVALAGYALSRDALVWRWQMLVLFALYPVWGVIQQFLVQALVVGNLVDTVPALRSAWRVTPIAAALFGAVHWPDRTLVVATFALGCVFTPMYLRWRNLWPLGLYHGWLGVLTYYWVLGRDPWVEMFG